MISNINKAEKTIIVDADACPVLEPVARVAREARVAPVFIASTAHCLPDFPGVEKVMVDSFPQAVDMAVINRVRPGDIVVTQDFGLATMVLARGAKAISPRGLIFDEANIDYLLLQRHISAKIRRGGGRTKGPRALAKQDLARFERNLRKLIGVTAHEPSSPV